MIKMHTRFRSKLWQIHFTQNVKKTGWVDKMLPFYHQQKKLCLNYTEEGAFCWIKAFKCYFLFLVVYRDAGIVVAAVVVVQDCCCSCSCKLSVDEFPAPRSRAYVCQESSPMGWFSNHRSCKKRYKSSETPT